MTSTPTLHELINNQIANYLSNLSFGQPGKITKVVNNNKVFVQPSLKFTVDDKLISMPVITDVPVIQLRTLNAGVSIPLAVGDNCFLAFSERSIDVWLNKGGEVDPSDDRTNSLNDAVAIIGLNSFAEFKTDHDPYPDSVTLRNKNTFLRLHPDGKIAFGTKTDEVLDILNSFLDEMINSITTSTGAPISAKAQLILLQTKLGNIKGSL